ncbi:MAG: hypothetical protein VYD54_10065 [Bdellovibrionota bacterium]|nr:hypothetical protein [Bdellovibrionota bacterium]
MEIYKYSKSLGAFSNYFPLFFLFFSLGSVPLIYFFCHSLTPFIQESFGEWATISFFILLGTFAFYLFQMLLVAWIFSFYISEKYILHQNNIIYCLKRSWPFKHKKEYLLSEVTEVRIKPFLGNSIFKIEFKGEIFLVVKYTWSYEKAKKIGNAINLTTGLPIKDEV